MTLFEQLREEALKIGLDDLGIIAASDSVSQRSFQRWLDSGCCSGMSYLKENRTARCHPSGVFPPVKTLLVAVLSLAQIAKEFNPLLSNFEQQNNSKTSLTRSCDGNSPKPAALSDNRSDIEKDQAFVFRSDETKKIKGRIVPYAVYPDYHDLLKAKLRRLLAFLKDLRPETEGRTAVDTAPLPEKEWAVRAGLGKIGRQSLLIHPQAGCSIFIGSLLVTLDFDQFGVKSVQKNFENFDSNPESSKKESFCDLCSGCFKCVQHCPTGAIQSGRTIDARKCLNFWTIENREFDSDKIPEKVRKSLGNRLFGCDECARCCPLNNRNNAVPNFEIELSSFDNLSEKDFRKLFRKTPMFRTCLNGLKRNIVWIQKNDLESKKTDH